MFFLYDKVIWGKYCWCDVAIWVWFVIYIVVHSMFCFFFKQKYTCMYRNMYVCILIYIYIYILMYVYEQDKTLYPAWWFDDVFPTYLCFLRSALSTNIILECIPILGNGHHSINRDSYHYFLDSQSHCHLIVVMNGIIHSMLGSWHSHWTCCFYIFLWDEKEPINGL